MFFFVLLINMMRSRVSNHIQAVPESASERDMRIRTVADPAGSVVPEPCASTLPVGRGRRVGRQTDKAAGSRAAGSRRYVLPAVCPSPSSPAPVGKQRPHCQVPTLAEAPSPRVRLPIPSRARTTGSPPPVAPDGARTSSSLSSSLDGAAPGSGAGILASCSCSTRLRRARMRWCRAAYSWPVSLELAWDRQREMLLVRVAAALL